MGVTRGRFRYQPFSSPKTPGAGLDSEYRISRNPTSYDVLGGVSVFSPPSVVTAFVPVEGTDYPFYTRENISSPDFRRYALRNFIAFQQSTKGIGTPLPIVNAPADTTPILVRKVDFYPTRNIGSRNRFALGVAAATNLSDGLGSWIMGIPAGSYTIPVCEVLSEVQELLMENVNGGASFDSGLWTVAEVLANLNLRISRFLMDTGCLQVRSTQAAGALAEFYDLPADLIDLRRVGWTSGGSTKVLPRADSLQADLAYGDWDSTPSTTPTVHMMVPEKSLEIRVAPQTSVAGTLDFIYVKDAPTVTNDCSIMPLPDEWVPYVKWGLLADLLSKEGEANDPERAAYAETRFQEGVQLARLYMGIIG